MTITFAVNQQTRIVLTDMHRDVTKESALRHAAEDRLEQLVDMYGDPAVNEELRSRLPHASQGPDVRKAWQQELDDLIQSELEEEQSKRPLRRSGTFEILKEAEPSTNDTTDTKLQQKGAEFRIGNEVFSGLRSHSPPKDSHPTLQQHPLQNTTYPILAHPGGGVYPGLMSPGMVPAQQMYLPGQTVSPTYHPMMQSPFSTYLMPNVPIQQLQQINPLAPPGTSPNQQPQHIAHAQSAPTPQTALSTQTFPGVQGGNNSALSYPTTMLLQSAPLMSPSTSPQNQSGIESSNVPIQSIQPPVTTAPPATSHTADATTKDPGIRDAGGGDGQRSHNAVSDPAVVRSREREQQRQIAQLLAELDRTKLINKKLEEELHETSKQLEIFKLSEKTQQSATEAEVAGKSAVLMEEIYSAQKERDESVMKRLRIANDERDEALARLKATRIENLSNVKDSANGMDVDMDKMLRVIESGMSSKSLQEQSEQLYSAVQAASNKRRDVGEEEVYIVMKQRDEAVTKCEELKSEVLSLERRIRTQAPDKQQQTIVQAKLLATQQERDLALAKIRKQDEEMETLRVYYSLHKSLSQEKNLRDQFNNTLAHVEGQLHNRDQTLDVAQKQNNQLLSQLKHAQADSKESKMQQMKALNFQREAEQNAHKLERLVNVLRRKIAELSSQ